MPVQEVLTVAIRGILVNKLRSALTMLGIMVGVGSVIVLIAFSEGQKREILKRFDMLGAGRMGVFLKKWGNGLTAPDSEELGMGDVQAIRDGVSMIALAVPAGQHNEIVRLGPVSLPSTGVTATEPEFFSVDNDKFTEGAPFTDDDNISLNRVCVLGSNTKYNLFFDAPAVGKYIFVAGKRFQILGVMAEKGGNRWQSSDDRVVIPYNTAVQWLPDFTGGLDEIDMRVADPKYSEAAQDRVREVLHLRHPRVPVPPDNPDIKKVRDADPIAVWNVAQQQQQRTQTAESMQKFLVVMGALSLLIGGVGVMNIMLVTVQERTREIGLRKAIGATGSSILAQFLTESVVMCTLGGTIGTLAAVVACKYMAHLPPEAQVPPPQITPVAIFVAVAVTVSVGLFFGVYPATRAAALEPITALRHE